MLKIKIIIIHKFYLTRTYLPALPPTTIILETVNTIYLQLPTTAVRLYIAERNRMENRIRPSLWKADITKH